LPDVAFRVREAVDDPDASPESVATMIQTAPTLAAFCMKTANSAAYSPTTPITGIREAVVRLGLNATRDLVVGYCMRALFKASHPEFETVMREIWWHSCQVGAVACVLARQLKTVNPEQALLAGLVHDIGSVVLVSEAQKHMKNGIDAVTLTTLIRELRGQVSAMVLRRWNFDESIVEAAMEAENWSHDSGEGMSIADLVILAHVHVRNSLPTWTAGPPANEAVPAYGKLPESGDEMESRLELIDNAAADVDTMLSLLRG
ncbi:MAG: HDOD domain-containing protein, partial [Gammaproteobacteria bacterium]|nr:HDOD domain-containing protein [Gammaproteobacteria bacterium]